MKIHELKENEMEQVCGGSFFTDWKDVPQRIGTESAEPENPGFPHLPVDWIARGKC